MAQIKVPYLKWRDGRPRWSPGPGLRARGFKDRDLKDSNGEWLSLTEAVDAARALNAAADAARAHGLSAAPIVVARPIKIAPPVAPPPVKQDHPVSEVIAEYLKTKRFKADETERVYRYHCRIIRDWAGDIPVASVTLQAMNAFYRQIEKGRGLTTAIQLMKTWKIILNFAVKNEWLVANRAIHVEMGKLEGRIVIWTEEELATFDTAASRLDRMSVADGVFLGCITTQRPSDILPLTTKNIQGDYLRLTPKKTGNPVSIRVIDKTLARLEVMASRKAARWPSLINHHLLICETTGLAYRAGNFGKQFREVRAEAAKLCPSIAAKRFSDLRDTGVTRLAESGCSLTEIASMTGHKMGSVAEILDKHYLLRTDALADSAGAKLEAYLNAKDRARKGPKLVR